jgi:hypothetical protein
MSGVGAPAQSNAEGHALAVHARGDNAAVKAFAEDRLK